MRNLINRIERIETASGVAPGKQPTLVLWDVFDVGKEGPSPGPADIIAGPLSGQRIEPLQGETCETFHARVNQMVDAAKSPMVGGAS